MKVGYETPGTSKEWFYDTLDGTRGSYTAYGVKVEGNTEWFSNKSIQKALKTSGKLGKIGFRFVSYSTN